MAISINFFTYDRLTHEAPVAEVQFRERAPQHFWVYITLPHTRAMVFDLRGDEWQLDARILKWHGIAFLFGFDTVYRLDRLSGRYRDIAQERTAERTVYSLGEDRGFRSLGDCSEIRTLAPLDRCRLWKRYVHAYGRQRELQCNDQCHGSTHQTHQ